LGEAAIAYRVEDRNVIIVRIRYGGQRLAPEDMLE
jgi:plasmid stabilization system protein ParE